MFNLLIIAKDQNSIDRIKNVVTWEDFGFHQINSAQNLPQIKRYVSSGSPNLVIIDTQFQDADALAIIQEIRRQSHDTQIIVITSEKDFLLAQSVINLQIAALLLWENLSSDILHDMLKRIVVNLDDRLHRQGIIKRQLFRDILKGKIPTSEEISLYFGTREPNANYVMFLIKRDMADSVLLTDQSPVLDYYAVNWHGSNFPEELSYIATVNISMHTWCSLLQIREVRSTARTHAISHSAAVALQSSFKHQFLDTVSIAHSRPFSSFSETLSVLKLLDACLDMQRFYGRARLCSYANFHATQSSCEDFLRITGESFSSAMLNENLEEAISITNHLFRELEKGTYQYSCVAQACKLLTTIINGYCIKKQIATLEERMIHGKLPSPYCYGTGEMKQWFKTIITLLIQEPGTAPDHHYSQKIQAVIDYLAQNYEKDTDVNTLASHFHISSDYLRHLFKKETGENLSGYITHIKIEKAKLLLSTGHYKIYEVAQMTGFNTSQYFVTVFRKQTGLTPRDFLRQCITQPPDASQTLSGKQKPTKPAPLP